MPRPLNQDLRQLCLQDGEEGEGRRGSASPEVMSARQDHGHAPANGHSQESNSRRSADAGPAADGQVRWHSVSRAGCVWASSCIMYTKVCFCPAGHAGWTPHCFWAENTRRSEGYAVLTRLVWGAGQRIPGPAGGDLQGPAGVVAQPGRQGAHFSAPARLLHRPPPGTPSPCIDNRADGWRSSLPGQNTCYGVFVWVARS